MRLSRVVLLSYRSIDTLDFEAGPFTVLFGKNNAGKTNILEAIYGVLAPAEVPGHLAGNHVSRAVRGADDFLPPTGAVEALLDPGQPFDDELLFIEAPEEWEASGGHYSELFPRYPSRQQVSFVTEVGESALARFDPRGYLLESLKLAMDFCDSPELTEQFTSRVNFDGPRPRPLFVDWEFGDIDQQVAKTVAMIISELPAGEIPEEQYLEQVRSAMETLVSSLGTLATGLLPDFVDGSISAELLQSSADSLPEINVQFQERRREYTGAVSDVGRGAARWIAAAVQIALHCTKHAGNFSRGRTFSGHVLFIDEPEAHLHPSAAASIVRWCQKMVRLGFNIVVASHHEAFLRANARQTLVRVTRDPETFQTRASTLPSLSNSRLLELADDVGMHRAAALSLRRAFLFVEGTLDEAVLDEYAGLELDAAGVEIIPIHGTKNLEGLVALEMIADLAIKMGVLTDATDPATMLERAKRKRSSEEKKVIEVLRIAEERHLPTPAVFGVPEADLLFALPADAIRRHVCESFPGWKELVEECRESLGKTPAESVNWKAYAAEKYGLRIDTPGGVRELVRKLDLANVALPSIRTVVDQVIEWANATAS